MARRKQEEAAPKAAPTEPGEFVIGRPEFVIGDPFEASAKAPPIAPTEFVIGGPPDAPSSKPKSPPTEFVIGGPLPSTGAPAGLPPLPRGWEPLPIQPPWNFSEDEPLEPGELRRIDRPRKRYRGLSAIRAYVDPDHVEEIIDILVFNAQKGIDGPESVSGFLFAAVREELDLRRKADDVGGRYPTYSQDGIHPKRGRRAGDVQVTPRKREPLRPVVARIPAAIADEIRDCVIHRNGGQADGPNTVSQFVADAIGAALADQRKLDVVSRYPKTSVKEREAHLDPRVLRGSSE